MPIKPTDLLDRLPSVAELLDKPPIRALAERWNKSVVAGGVRYFLDELRSDLERRAADLPSIRELAERAARYVAARQQNSLGVGINATGSIFGSPWTSAPLAETALERSIEAGREFGVGTGTTTDASPAELQPLLCRLTGCQSAAIVHSYPSAIWLALAALAADREVLVARGEVGDVDGNDSLPKLATAAGVILKEVGATNRSSAADYESAASPRTAAVLKLSTDSYRVVGDTASAEIAELVAIGRGRQLFTVDALGAAPLVNPPASIAWSRRSAQASIAAGVDLVVVRGDGLLNGPSCGILLGTQAAIERIKAHPLFSGLQIDPLRAAALTATIECYDSPTLGADTLPVWQCLITSIDNLRNRAERLAAQLVHVEGVATAIAIDTRSLLTSALTSDTWPSYGVALSPTEGNVVALDNRLKSARFPIYGRIEGDRLVLDLRTVLPRHDKTIVDSLLGAAPSDTTT